MPDAFPEGINRIETGRRHQPSGTVGQVNILGVVITDGHVRWVVIGFICVLMFLVGQLALSDMGHTNVLSIVGINDKGDSFVQTHVGRNHTPPDRMEHFVKHENIKLFMKQFEDFCIWEELHKDNAVHIMGQTEEIGTKVDMRFSRPNHEQVVELEQGYFTFVVEVYEDGEVLCK